MHDTITELIQRHMALGAPEDQQQLIALLQDVQAQSGGVLTASDIAEIARSCGVREVILRVLIRRVPSLRIAEAPHRLEICGRCAGGHALANWIEQTYDVTPGGISRTGGFSYHVTPCLKNCRNGPSVRWDGTLYSHADAELLKRLIG